MLTLYNIHVSISTHFLYIIISKQFLQIFQATSEVIAPLSGVHCTQCKATKNLLSIARMGIYWVNYLYVYKVKIDLFYN